MLSIEELRKLDVKELIKNLEKARNNLYKIQLTVKGDKKTPPSEVKKNKKYIARIKTIINEQQDSTNQ